MAEGHKPGTVTRALESSAAMDRARDQLETGKIPDAIDTVRKISAMNPSSNEELAKVVHGYGLVHLKKEDYQNAVDLLALATDLDPFQVQPFLEAAFCYEKLGVDRAAIGYYYKAIQLDPYNLEALKRMASACRRANEYSQAEAALEMAIKIELTPDLLVQLGEVQMLNKKRLDAAQTFRNVLKMAPDSPFALKAKLLLEELAI